MVTSQSTASNRALPFQRLHAYQVALALVRLAGAVPTQRGTADTRDQLRRAASSVALNIAEGCGKTGADRRRFFLIARGSACEAGAALDVLAAFGALGSAQLREGQALCDRLYAMLTKLSHAA